MKKFYEWISNIKRESKMRIAVACLVLNLAAVLPTTWMILFSSYASTTKAPIVTQATTTQTASTPKLVNPNELIALCEDVHKLKGMTKVLSGLCAKTGASAEEQAYLKESSAHIVAIEAYINTQRLNIIHTRQFVERTVNEALTFKNRLDYLEQILPLTSDGKPNMATRLQSIAPTFYPSMPFRVDSYAVLDMTSTTLRTQIVISNNSTSPVQLNQIMVQQWLVDADPASGNPDVAAGGRLLGLAGELRPRMNCAITMFVSNLSTKGPTDLMIELVDEAGGGKVLDDNIFKYDQTLPRFGQPEVTTPTPDSSGLP